MLSVILPVRDWPEERIAASAQSLLRLESNTLTELLIVDFGSERPLAQRLRGSLADKRLSLLRVEAEVWSPGEAINIGALHARGAVIAKTDADIIVAADAGPTLDAAAKAVEVGRIGLALAQATDLPEGLDATSALDAPCDALDRAGRLRPRWGQGGLAIFSRATWDAIGGFDSRFTGWGNEDNDFAERVRHSGRKVRWLDREAVRIYHVWHPPSVHNKGVLARRAENVEIARNDRSVLRPLRILHSTPPAAYRGKALQHPNVQRRAAPLVTVAIATAERPGRTRMLKESIRAFVGQADNELEIVVADNGSTKAEHARLAAELRKMRLPVRLHLLHLEDASIPAARNAITDVAEGRHICVADDDDIALPTRLADHLACFEHDPDLHGSHGGWIDFDELTGIIEINEGKERTLETLLFGTGKITAHPTALYRADVLKRLRYDESLALGSDLDLALRMAHAGMRVGHTGSFVVLRRFHAANVTVTGLANQVSNGAFARLRLKDRLGPALCDALAARAREADGLAVCRNRIDPQRVVEMLPARAGLWRLHFPLTALGAAAGAPVDPDAAAKVLEIVDGDIGSVGCGIDIELSFISERIRGAGKAVRLKRRLAALGIAAELIADQDFEERRRRGFDWTRLVAPDGTRRLLSDPIDDPVAVTEALAALPPGSALRGIVSTIADHAPEGPRYHLVTAPLEGSKAAAAAAAALRASAPVGFATVGSGGIVCDF